MLFDQVGLFGTPRDWRIDIDEPNGAGDYFTLRDMGTNQIPFRVEGEAGSFALFVEQGGNIGLSESDPERDLHITSINSPTIRLEQPQFATFNPQVWDIGGNEINFFVRDSTGEDTLPFRIAPDAPDNAMTVAAGGGNVGLGVWGATVPLHVRREDGTARVLVEEASGVRLNSRILLELVNNGAAQVAYRDTSTGADWRTQNFEDSFRITRAGTGQPELRLDPAGNLQIAGVYTQISDRNAKSAIEPIDPSAILDKVGALPVSMWSYSADEAGIRHIGPMAQDFHALFGTGSEATAISLLDASGVALAAIQALRDQNAALGERNAAQQGQIDRLMATLATQTTLIAQLQTRIALLEAGR